MVITVVDGAEAAVAELSREVIGGFLEFFVAEDLNSEVGASVLEVRD